jgi:hypothetical protein
MNTHSTTFAKATLEYDAEHETALMEVITEAIFEVSKVSDADAVVLRTAEIANALLMVLAGTLALSPSVARSPTTIRRTIDGFGKHLRRKISAAETNEDLQDFMRRTFRGGGTEGNA